MSICGCDVPAALLRRRLSACFVLVLSAFASVAVAAAEGGSPTASADSDDIPPVSLGRLDGCEFHYVCGMNDGLYPGGLAVAGGSTCDQETRPYIWRNGSWLQRDMPLVTPGFAGWVTSVSDDHPEQPTQRRTPEVAVDRQHRQTRLGERNCEVRRRVPGLPRAAFRRVLRDRVFGDADESFDLLAHLNRIWFIDLLGLLDGRSGAVECTMRAAALCQLTALSHAIGAAARNERPAPVPQPN